MDVTTATAAATAATDNESFLLKLLNGTFGIIIAGMAWFLNTAHLKVEKQAENIQQLRADHNEFMVEVANDYAKTHTVESMFDKVDNKLETMSQDIKALLQRR